MARLKSVRSGLKCQNCESDNNRCTGLPRERIWEALLTVALQT